jgi:hypothetical protein
MNEIQEYPTKTFALSQNYVCDHQSGACKFKLLFGEYAGILLTNGSEVLWSPKAIDGSELKESFEDAHEAYISRESFLYAGENPDFNTVPDGYDHALFTGIWWCLTEQRDRFRDEERAFLRAYRHMASKVLLSRMGAVWNKYAEYLPGPGKRVNGYVYLVQSPTGAYKIGRSKNPKDRLKTFGVLLPFEVSYVTVIPTSNMSGMERALHNTFAEKRINGEWFMLTPEDRMLLVALGYVFGATHE